MIPGLEPISVNHLSFAALSGGAVLVAWFRWRAWFLPALLALSAAMVASWLTPLALAALGVFLAVPYVAARALWGKGDRASASVIAAAVLWQVGLFVYLRRYEWVEFADWLSHPVAVVGISFMLFRVVHLIVDAPYLGHLPLSPARYVAYVAAFWTLLSGPIQRYDAFCQGLDGIGRPPVDRALAAGHRGVNGLLKAFVIAPLFLPAADIAGLAAPGATWLDFAVVFYAYPVYLYLNFSGYTDVVIALARLCGMETMPENFHRPYLARNVQDFWTRWHISFSTWIRHYVFTPISKRLLAAAPPSLESASMALAVVLTFVIVGAWHGTTLNFVVFGILHGMAIVAAGIWGGALKAVLGPARRKAFESHPVTRVVAVVLCFHFVCATMALFANPLDALTGALVSFFAAA